MALVHVLRARSSVDPGRVYAVGYSMGAIGLWDILVRAPDLFTAAVLVAGDLDVSSATPLASFPLWAIVGGKDDIVPPDRTRAFARMVATGGGTARVTEIATSGHDVWKDAFAHRPLWDWLLSISNPPD